MHQIGPIGEHGQRFDLTAMRQSVARVPVQLFGDVAGLHGQHRHAVFAMQRLGGDGQRRDIALMPIEDEQVFRAMPGRRHAGLGNDPHIGVRREADRPFERHVHRRDAERRRRQDQSIHALRHGMANDIRGEDVGAGRQMRAVLLDAARRQDYQRVGLQLRRDFGLREVDEITARQHGASAPRLALPPARRRPAPAGRADRPTAAPR